MGRPLNKKYFGNRNIGSANTTTDNGIGGQVLSAVTVTTNNSTGYTNGSAVTFSAPTLPRGVTATGSVVTFGAAGALTDKTTYTRAGTSVAAIGTYTGVVQKSGTNGGTGAVFTIVKSTSATTYAAPTVTVTTPGSGYTIGSTIVIDGSLLGGVTTTNDLTLTVASFVAGTGTIQSILITNSGSGYESAPTFTIANPGTQGLTTLTSVLSTNTGIVGTASSQEPAIKASAFTVANNQTADINKQVSGRRYNVTTAEGTAICKLVTATPAAIGEMTIIATDSSSNTYYVTKLTNHRATLTPLTGSSHEFVAGSATRWTFDSASFGESVTIQNA